ncbi:MAG TPA: alpha/beta fold hydrolase [Bacteroidia bacterium]|nr:alpha/beta fold hydrolase [Bacteroidia bacterium]
MDSDSLGRKVLVREWSVPDPCVGTVLVLHGLGDHSGWHDWAAQLLGAAGFRAVAFDWPGNGGSDGIRGDVPPVAEAGAFLAELMEREWIAPAGIFAHSTGAFLLLSWLGGTASECVWMRSLKWVWLSSPLLRPSHGQPRLKIAVARRLAAIFPRMTLDTGVAARDCFHTCADPKFDEWRRRDGGHHRIALRFAADLIAKEQALDGVAARISPKVDFLLTQGIEDPVCPPGYAEALFGRLPAERKALVMMAGARHEPHGEPFAENVVNAVRPWLVWQGVRTKEMQGMDGSD